jgi:hypothetical protein
MVAPNYAAKRSELAKSIGLSSTLAILAGELGVRGGEANDAVS